MTTPFQVRFVFAFAVVATWVGASDGFAQSRPTYRDQDWRSAGSSPRRPDARTAQRDYDDRSYDRSTDRYDDRGYDPRRYDRYSDGVRPDSPVDDRYDPRYDDRRDNDRRAYDRPVDDRATYDRYDRPDYRRGASYRDGYDSPPRDAGGWRAAGPWQPVGEARPVDNWRPVDSRRTAWQMSPADARPSLGGATGSFVQPLDGVQPGYVGRGYGCAQPGAYGYGPRGLGYNTVPMNAPLNNSWPTTQVAPINNIQPLPGYGGSGMLPGQQYFGRNDFNDNGWNWGSNRSVPWRPLIPISAPAQNYVVGQGLWGQPKVYIPQQPVRNFFRYLSL